MSLTSVGLLRRLLRDAAPEGSVLRGEGACTARLQLGEARLGGADRRLLPRRRGRLGLRRHALAERVRLVGIRTVLRRERILIRSLLGLARRRRGDLSRRLRVSGSRDALAERVLVVR